MMFLTSSLFIVVIHPVVFPEIGNKELEVLSSIMNYQQVVMFVVGWK